MNDEWSNIVLDDLIDEIIDRRGVTPSKLGSTFVDHGHRVISAKAIDGNRVDLSSDEPRFVTNATYRRWMKRPLAEDDVLLTSEAPLGEAAYIHQEVEWCLGQRLFGIRTIKDKLYGRFLYYALQSEFVRHELLSRATGTTAQGIRQSELRRVRIPTPSIETQKRIANILGTIDDKIELNRLQCHTLERLAASTFKSWFIDFDPVRVQPCDRDSSLPNHLKDIFPNSFGHSELGSIPEGWRVSTLGEIAREARVIVRPDAIKPRTPYIALEHMPMRSIVLSEWGTADHVASDKLVFEKDQILFGKLRPYFHKVGIAPVNGVCSTDIVVVIPKTPDWCGFVLGHVSGRRFVNYTDAHSTGTRMPRTSWKFMKQYEIPVPPVSVAQSFNNLIRPILQRIVATTHSTHLLSTMRDALLPGLVSGQIRVLPQNP